MGALISWCFDPFGGLWVMSCLWPRFGRLYLEYLFSTEIDVCLYMSSFLAYFWCPQMTQLTSCFWEGAILLPWGFGVSPWSVLFTWEGPVGSRLLPVCTSWGCDSWLLQIRAVLSTDYGIAGYKRWLFCMLCMCVHVGAHMCLNVILESCQNVVNL